MKRLEVIDTNVAVAANGRETHVGSPCALRCIDALTGARSSAIVLHDGLGHIFDEYRRYLSPTGQPGTGDAFFKWLWDNQANPEHCRRVPITLRPGQERDFEEIPRDPDLLRLDPSDRVFLATALAAGAGSVVVNATDSHWRQVREAANRHGITVENLCPEHMSSGG